MKGTAEEMEKKYTLVEQVRRDFRVEPSDLPEPFRQYIKHITLPDPYEDRENQFIGLKGEVTFYLPREDMDRALAEKRVSELFEFREEILLRAILNKLRAFVKERKTDSDAVKSVDMKVVVCFVQEFQTRLAEPRERSRDGCGGETFTRIINGRTVTVTTPSYMDPEDDWYEEESFSFYTPEEYARVLDTVAAWRKSGLTIHDFRMKTDPAYREEWERRIEEMLNGGGRKAPSRTDKGDAASAAAPEKSEKPAPAPREKRVRERSVDAGAAWERIWDVLKYVVLAPFYLLYFLGVGIKRLFEMIADSEIGSRVLKILLIVVAVVLVVVIVVVVIDRTSRKEVLTFDEGTTVIEANAFADNEYVERVEIPASVTTIKEGAFFNCDKLKEVVFAEGSQLQTIEKEAFYECDVLASITLPEGVVTIGDRAFGWTSITTLHIPASVTSIGAEAVNSEGGVTSLTVAEGNSVYDSRGGCNAIIETATNTLILGCDTTVIPDGTAAIVPYAFYRCHFTEITLPASVETLRENSFRSCDSLTKVTLTGVQVIEKEAFSHCDALRSVVVFDCLERLSAEFAVNCGDFEGIVDRGVKYIGNTQNPYLAAFGTMGNMTGLHTSTRVIADGAFMFSWIPTLPEGLRVIGDGAFDSSANTTTLRIPASVTYIGAGAFKGSKDLTAITVADGNAVYDSREDCNAIIETATNRMIVGCKTSTVPEGVTAIATGALYFPERSRAVVIPESVTVLEEAVGSWSIGNVYYCGTAADWSAVTVGEGNDDVTDDLYFYSEQAPIDEGKCWHYDTSNQPVAW